MYHTLLTLSFISFVIAQNKLISPCPRFFKYEVKSKQPDTWYGILTMLSDFDTYGVYAHISLNKPALQFGNWYSAVFTENNQEFILANSKDRLKANVPKTIRFFVKYNTSEPPPVIEWIVANSRKICPDDEITETTTTRVLESIPRVQLDFRPKPSPVEATSNHPDGSGGLIDEAPDSPKNKNFYKDDLNLLFSLSSSRDLNILNPLLKNETLVRPSPVKATSNKPAGGLVRPAPALFEGNKFYKDDLNLPNETSVRPSPVETTSIKPGKGSIGKAPASFEDKRSYKDDLHLLTALIKNENFFGPVELDFESNPSRVETTSNKPAAGGLTGEALTSPKNDKFFKDDLNLPNETSVRPSPIETTSIKPGKGSIGKAPASFEDKRSYNDDLHLLTALIKNENFFGPVELDFESNPSRVETTPNKPAAGGLTGEALTSPKNDKFYKDDLNLLNTLLNSEKDLNLLTPLIKNETVIGPSPGETTSNNTARGFIDQTPASDEDEEFYMGDFYEVFNTLLRNETEDPTVDDICGTVVVPATPLITYGQPTNEGEFPWHVAIYHSRGINLTYICGASLVSQDFVITVAHCVTIPRSSDSLNPKTLTVYLGKHYLMHNSNPGIQNRQISEIIIHPDYNAQMYSDDIALLKLTLPAEYTDYVRPICLWQDSPNLNSIVDKQGKVVGWGYDENGIVTDRLMQTEMPVVSQDACLLSNPEFYSRYTSETTLCAGFRNGTTICLGDSGGGMIFPKSNSSPKSPVWQLRGLISISPAAHNKYKCDASHYAVFTDAAKYLDWIKYEIE